MSRTTMALVVKFLLTFLAAALAFRTLGDPWGWIVGVAAAGTILNYIIGDLVIFPAMGNLVASIMDGLLAAATAWVADWLTVADRTSPSTLAIFALLVTVAEFFFHRYLASDRKVAP